MYNHTVESKNLLDNNITTKVSSRLSGTESYDNTGGWITPPRFTLDCQSSSNEEESDWSIPQPSYSYGHNSAIDTIPQESVNSNHDASTSLDDTFVVVPAVPKPRKHRFVPAEIPGTAVAKSDYDGAKPQAFNPQTYYGSAYSNYERHKSYTDPREHYVNHQYNPPTIQNTNYHYPRYAQRHIDNYYKSRQSVNRYPGPPPPEERPVSPTYPEPGGYCSQIRVINERPNSLPPQNGPIINMNIIKLYTIEPGKSRPSALNGITLEIQKIVIKKIYNVVITSLQTEVPVKIVDPEYSNPFRMFTEFRDLLEDAYTLYKPKFNQIVAMDVYASCNNTRNYNYVAYIEYRTKIRDELITIRKSLINSLPRYFQDNDAVVNLIDIIFGKPRDICDDYYTKEYKFGYIHPKSTRY